MDAIVSNLIIGGKLGGHIVDSAAVVLHDVRRRLTVRLLKQHKRLWPVRRGVTDMQSRPDICVLGLNFPPEPTGIAPYTGALSSALQLGGHTVVAHVGHPHYPEWSIREGYGQWSRTETLNGVLVKRLLHYVPRSPRGLRRLMSELSFGIRVITTRWRRPRVVVAVSPSLFATALAMLRIKLTPRPPRAIVWVQDLYTLGLAETGEGNSATQQFTRWVESRVLRAADKVVVIHERFAGYIIAELGVAPAKVEVIRNWTHLPRSEMVDTAFAKKGLGWPTDATLAVHTGNMGAKQGLENIVEAARLADEMRIQLHFILVGDGGERRKLEELARGVSRLSFVDPLGAEDYRLALSAADVLLVNEKPGVATMAVPSKLTSYFDAGRPVIAATESDGITASEVASAAAGLVVPAGDPRALLNAIVHLIDNPDSMLQMGKCGRQYRDNVLDPRAAMIRWQNIIATQLAAQASDTSQQL